MSPPSHVSPPHVFFPVSTSNPPHPPIPALVSPYVDHFLSPSPHVSSSIDPPLPALHPHVSQTSYSLDTVITSSIVDARIYDIDIETFDSALMSTFSSNIFVHDRGFTYGSRDIDAPGSGGGHS
jgi:hypothetical protein